MTTHSYFFLALLVTLSTAGILLGMGRVPYCECGFVSLWTGTVNGPENSQQLSDWYAPSHFIHGVLFFSFLFLILRRTSIGFRFVIAIILEASWEIFENSPFIINRYREATIAVGYTGDSVINSIADIAFMSLGFLFARYIPVWLSVALVIFLELFVGYMIHDNLFLNIVMLVYPLDIIKVWQGSL
jgi:hypothetical protein